MQKGSKAGKSASDQFNPALTNQSIPTQKRFKSISAMTMKEKKEFISEFNMIDDTRTYIQS